MWKNVCIRYEGYNLNYIILKFTENKTLFYVYADAV